MYACVMLSMDSAHASGLRELGCLVCMRGYLKWWRSKASHSRQSAARDVDHSGQLKLKVLW